jgi:hypothetical protein
LIGGAASQGGNTAAAAEAMKQGQLDTGAQYQRLAMQDKQTAQADKDRQIKMLGGVAKAAKYEQDPARRALLWQTGLKRAGINPADLDPEELDPMTGPDVFIAAAGMADDPRESKLMDLKLQGAQLDIANAQRGKMPDLQEVYTETGGKQKGYFQNGQFVPVGGTAQPRSEMLTAGDRKAILEADDKTQANASAIGTLRQALELNKTANAGWGAGVRTSLGTNLPDLLVPDAVSSPESGQAAAELDNAIIGNALEQLKATFGGMPTEGERKILIDIQGSINQPRAVRQKIYERALQLAEQRLEVNKQEAEKLRGGTYYKPGGAAALPSQNQRPAAAPSGAMDLGDGFTIEVDQ